MASKTALVHRFFKKFILPNADGSKLHKVVNKILT